MRTRSKSNKKTKLDDFINQLPNGLDTIVGEDGIRLSEDRSKELLLLDLYIIILKY